MIKVGDKAELVRTITDEDILAFAEVSGDKNPVHLDEEFAKTTIFNKRIAHGMLSASFISNVIGNQLPGEGTIYMAQSLKFCAPVYIGDTITTEVEVIQINEEKGNIALKTVCLNQNREPVIVGEALVKNKQVLGI